MLHFNTSAACALFVSTGLKSIAVLGTAWLVTILCRGRSAAFRHLIWTAAFAALLVLPLLSITLPALSVPFARALPHSLVFRTTTAAAPVVPASPTPASARASRPIEPPVWRPDLPLWLLLLWATGAAASFAHMLIACAAIARVRLSATPFTGLDLPTEVAVLRTPPGSMPMTCGLFRPAVFLPSDASAWSPDRRRFVLQHELAHVHRGDLTTHVLARTALCLYWWNPLAWTAWHEFLRERERAADDVVLSAGARPSDYATHLLAIARALQSSPAVEWAAVAMAGKSELEGRLQAILDANRNRETPGRTSALACALFAITLLAPLAAVRAQESTVQVPPSDADAAIRAARAQKNYDMLDQAADAAASLLKYDAAQKLLEASLAIRKDVSGSESIAFGQGLLRLGDLKRGQGELAAAKRYYEQALSVFGSRPEAAPALLHLATIAWSDKHRDQALSYLQKAQFTAPAQAASALMWIALLNRDTPPEAESAFKQALALEAPDSVEAATTLELYAQFLTEQNRSVEALALQDRATAAWNTQTSKAPLVRPASIAKPYRIGGSLTPPSLLSKVEPGFTEEARLAKYEGTVVLSVEIGIDGLAYNIRTIRSLGLGLEQKATQAITQWKFKPGARDGQPVPVLATIEVNFRLL